jgi:predicted metal-dependent peptidase
MPATSNFIDVHPRGTTPFEVGVRDLRNWVGYLYRACLRGMKHTTATKYGMMDGRFGYYNLDVLNTLKASNCAFVVGHENCHLNLNHAERFRRYREVGAQIFWKGQNWCAANVASDLIINAWLRDLNIEARQAMIDAGLEPFDVMTPLGDILIDEKDLYDTDKEDLSSEQLVEKILKTHPVPPVNVNSGGSEQSDEEGDEAGNGSGTPNPDSGDEAGDQDGGDSGDENDSNGEHEGESGKGGSESDEHGESPSPDGSGGGATTGEFGGGHDDFCEPELEDGETLEEFDAANREAAQQASYEERVNETKGLSNGGAGTFASSDLKRTTNRVPWNEHLANWFQARSEEGWDRPFCTRTFDRTGVVRRARGSKVAGELVFLVDTSGSNVNRMGPMLDKVQEVLDQFQPRLTHVVPCDTRVHTTHEVDAGGQLPETLEGGGGTLLKPALDWAEENAPNADGIIYLTDGYTWRYDWQEMREPHCPVLWLCFGYHAPEDIGVTCYPFGERVAINIA